MPRIFFFCCISKLHLYPRVFFSHFLPQFDYRFPSPPPLPWLFSSPVDCPRASPVYLLHLSCLWVVCVRTLCILVVWLMVTPWHLGGRHHGPPVCVGPHQIKDSRWRHPVAVYSVSLAERQISLCHLARLCQSRAGSWSDVSLLLLLAVSQTQHLAGLSDSSRREWSASRRVWVTGTALPQQCN